MAGYWLSPSKPYLEFNWDYYLDQLDLSLFYEQFWLKRFLIGLGFWESLMLFKDVDFGRLKKSIVDSKEPGQEQQGEPSTDEIYSIQDTEEGMSGSEQMETMKGVSTGNEVDSEGEPI